MFGFAGGLVIGLAIGLITGPAAGLVAGLTVESTADTHKYSLTGPREVVRQDLLFGLAGVLVGVLVAGLMVGLATENAGALEVEFMFIRLGALGVVIAGALAVGLVAGLMVGRAGIRYLVLVLCTRRWTTHWLPWRLGRFMDWCYQAGLLRIAGVGYQFRHDELQGYLARVPTADTGPAVLHLTGARWASYRDDLQTAIPDYKQQRVITS